MNTLSPSVVRSFDAYYEATGPFAIPKQRADEVFTTIADLAHVHAGPIAMRLRKADVQIIDNPVCIDDLTALDTPHSALLTGRTVVSQDGKELAGDSTTWYTEDGIIDESATLISNDNDGTRASELEVVSTGLHEFVHTLLVEHCESDDGHCAMQAIAPLEGFNADRFLRQPFCDDCAENVARAGHLILAGRL